MLREVIIPQFNPYKKINLNKKTADSILNESARVITMQCRVPIGRITPPYGFFDFSYFALGYTMVLLTLAKPNMLLQVNKALLRK